MTGRLEALKMIFSLPVEVELTEEELWFAGNVGWFRRLRARGNSIHDRSAGQGAQIDVDGARAECAFAKAVGIYWDVSVTRVGSTPAGDVSGYEIRSTPREDGSLILRPRDADEKRFVLVVGKAPNFRVVGAITGRDGKQQRFLRDPNGRPPAYFVPQSALETRL